MNLPVVIPTKENTPNPLVSRTGTLIYWEVRKANTGEWISLVGTRPRYKVVGISFDQDSARVKAEGRAIWEANR